MFDYSKLRGKIREKFKTQEAFCKVIKCSPTTLSAKLNNAADFSQKEITMAVDALELTQDEISVYFFTQAV